MITALMPRVLGCALVDTWAAALQGTVVPLPSRTTWSKITEFVFGL